MKLCTVCGVVTSRPGSRCTEHAPVEPQPAQRAVQHARLAAPERPSTPSMARRAWRLVPWLRASSPPRCRPHRRSRRAARHWRCAVRRRQQRGAVPLLQLDEGHGGRRPGVPTRGFCARGQPRLPSVRTRPGFARNPGRRWPTGAAVGPRGSMSRRMAVRRASISASEPRPDRHGWRCGR
jgi:hypothetical protein